MKEKATKKRNLPGLIARVFSIVLAADLVLAVSTYISVSLAWFQTNRAALNKYSKVVAQGLQLITGMNLYTAYPAVDGDGNLVPNSTHHYVDGVNTTYYFQKLANNADGAMGVYDAFARVPDQLLIEITLDPAVYSATDTFDVRAFLDETTTNFLGDPSGIDPETGEYTYTTLTAEDNNLSSACAYYVLPADRVTTQTETINSVPYQYQQVNTTGLTRHTFVSHDLTQEGFHTLNRLIEDEAVANANGTATGSIFIVFDYEPDFIEEVHGVNIGNDVISGGVPIRYTPDFHFTVEFHTEAGA